MQTAAIDVGSLVRESVRDSVTWSLLRPSKPEFSSISSVLSAADELTACCEFDTLLRLAVELARGRLGLERVGLYICHRDAERLVLRGTWGTGARGETTDERSLSHEISPDQYDALLRVRLAGGLGLYRPCAPLVASEHGRTVSIGSGWIMATPLLAAGAVIGVMYNDAGLTHAPMDAGKQGAAAVLCTLIAALLVPQPCTIARQHVLPGPGRSSLVWRILRTLEQEPATTGVQLACKFGVSSGHLARSFKREMAVSLVDYRNQIRMDRFFQAIHENGNHDSLLRCALEAGFGSYAQFHRVYRKLHRKSPRDIISNGATRHGPSKSRPSASMRPRARRP